MWSQSFLDPFLRVLLDAALKSTLLLAFAAVTCGLLRRSGAAVRHLIWSAALVCTLALPILVSTLPPWRLATWPGWSARGSATSSPAIDSGTAVNAAASASTPRTVRLLESLLLPEAAPVEAAPKSFATLRAHGAERWTAVRGASTQLILEPRAWLTAGWLAGVLAVLVLLAAGLRRTWRLGRSATELSEGALAEDARALANQMGLGPVRLLRAPTAVIPMTWGVLRPVILLPDGAGDWSAARRRAVLLHELAHIKRGDYLSQLMAQVACAVYWFNPLVWFGAARLRVERERASDDQVLCTGSRASDYATHLLEMALTLRSGGVRLAPVVAMAQPSQLGARVRDILDGGRRRTLLTPRLGFTAGLGVVLIGLPLAAVTGAPPETRLHEAEGRLAAAEVLKAEDDDRFAEVKIQLPFSTWIESGGDHMRVRLRSDGRTIKVESEGKVAFSDAEDDIVHIPPGGSFKLEERTRGRVRHEIEIRGRDGGVLERKYEVDGKKHEFDTEGRAWLAEILPEILRRTGYDAEGRVQRLLQRGGKDAVLREIEQISSDGIERRYYTSLLEYGDFDAAALREISQHASEHIRSDYERAEFLIAVATDPASDAAARAAYVEATRDMRSDYERRRALKALLEHGRLDAAGTQALLLSAAEIRSDYELAELLIEVAERAPLDAATAPRFFTALGSIGSDYEMRRVLDAVVKSREPDAALLRGLLRAAQDVGSDYEQAQFLVHLAQQHPIDALWTEDYFAAVATIGSNFERRRALRGLLEQKSLGVEPLRGMLQSAADMSSNYEIAELLIEMAEKHPIPAELRPDYFEAARRIGSNHERGRVLSAAAERGL